jgi:hypothetical protein
MAVGAAKKYEHELIHRDFTSTLEETTHDSNGSPRLMLDAC